MYSTIDNHHFQCCAILSQFHIIQIFFKYEYTNEYVIGWIWIRIFSTTVVIDFILRQPDHALRCHTCSAKLLSDVNAQYLVKLHSAHYWALPNQFSVNVSNGRLYSVTDDVVMTVVAVFHCCVQWWRKLLKVVVEAKLSTDASVCFC